MKELFSLIWLIESCWDESMSVQGSKFLDPPRFWLEDAFYVESPRPVSIWHANFWSRSRQCVARRWFPKRVSKSSRSLPRPTSWPRTCIHTFWAQFLNQSSRVESPSISRLFLIWSSLLAWIIFRTYVIFMIRMCWLLQLAFCLVLYILDLLGIIFAH